MVKSERLQSIRKIADKLLETLFLALTGIYLIYEFFKTTTFSLDWPSGFSKKLLAVMAVVAVLRLLTTRLVRWKTLAALGLAAVYLLVYRSDKYRFLQYLAVLTVGLIDIDYRKILRVFLCTVGVLYCVAVVAGMTGAIKNYIRIKSGLRSSWGICYPTDLASTGLYLLLTLWVERRRLPDWTMLVLSLGYPLLTWFIAHSYTSTVCALLLACATLYVMFERGVVDRREKLAWMKRGANLAATIAFVVCALAIFGLMFLYGRGTDIGYRIDDLMSNRLKYAVNAWNEHGSRAFGTRFPVYGNGFSSFPLENYTFVDSSYALVLTRYGWVMLVTLALTWGWTARNAIRCGDRRLLMVLCIIAMHSFSEHHFPEANYNILLVMPLAAYSLEDAEKKPLGKAVPAAAITTALFAGLLCLVGPALLSWLKTVLEYKDLCGGGETAPALVGILLAVLGVLAGCAWSVNRVLRAALSREGLHACRTPLIVLALCVVIGAGGWIYSNHAIDAAAAENAALIEADREALEIAVKAATGRVYSGILPSAYRRQIGGISYSAFFGDDLARHRGSTALIASSSEHGSFIDSGCLYVQISKKHALYTSDRAVIEALTAAGYHLTGYYSNVRKVSLTKAATANGLTYDKETGLELAPGHRTMASGPFYNLYGGKYTATYELSLPEDAERDDATCCTLSVTTYYGANVLLKKKVKASQFDENGILTVSIPFSIPDSRGVTFTAKAAKGRTVYVKSIRFTRTPDYDLHGLYDTQLRKVRDEYYTLEGAPTMGPQGYFAAEYGYDGRKNVNLIRYYNQNNELTLHTSGYAELRRVFNAKGQIVREEYYGTDGEPIALTSRQAAIEREYDADGNITVIRYFGIDGKPVITTSGYAEIHRTFDENRKVVSEEYYGIDGEPIPLTAGQYNITQEFDDDGNVTVRRFHGEDGALKLRSEGYAEVHWKYNGMHQIVKEEFFDTEGKPVMINGGYAADEREYDDAGNVTVYRYYDTEGQPIVIKSGYAELHRVYDGQRKVVREEYYGTDGQMIALYYGYCAIENEYDALGNVSVRRFYGSEGQPVMRTDGYAEVRWQYNDMRKVVREAFYGIDAAPVRINNGSAGNEREYDAAGNAKVYRYFDTDGSPAVIVSGYAEIHRTFNEKRQIIREEYYGMDGQPMMQPEGHFILEQEYDDMGNVAVKRYYDAENRPMAICDGYAEIRRTYNNKKQIIREAYFDAEGRPYTRAAGHVAIEQEFDDDGELAVRRYLDADGKPMQRVDGYAEARWAYDEDHVRYVAFYDLNGEEIPIEGLNLVIDAPDGWSRWYTPKKDTNNVNLNIANMTVGQKKSGDSYVCQIEIEFRNVAVTEGQAYAFKTHGEVNGGWTIANLWNTQFVTIREVPGDGIYAFTLANTVSEDMLKASVFNIGFRFDYWASGSFRVRSVKVEKNNGESVWTPGI